MARRGSGKRFVQICFGTIVIAFRYRISGVTLRVPVLYVVTCSLSPVTEARKTA